MTCAASNPRALVRTSSRLGPKIAVVLVVKLVGLTVIWLLFIRGQHVTTDAHSTARAFDLVGPDAESHSTLKEDVHGQ